MSDGARETFCFVLPWSFTLNGGVNQVVRNLMRALDEEQHREPMALELRWDPPMSDGRLPGTAIKHVSLKLRPAYIAEKPLRSVLAFLASAPRDLLILRRLVKRHRITVFNLHYPDLTGLNFVLLRMLGLFRGAVLLSFHGTDIRTARREKGWARKLWQFMLRHATAAVACSEGLKEEILMLESRAPAVTIHNSIDVRVFAANAGSEFRWPDALADKRIILNVGSFSYGKGQDVLIRAFHGLSARYPAIHLALVGWPGPTSELVRRLIADLGLERRIHIFENVPHNHMYDLFRGCALFVLATPWQNGEGFSVSILEAAAAQIPVVATDTCGVRELIEDGKTGRVVRLEDPQALAYAMSQMLDDAPAARRMAAQLYERVATQFTWSRAAARYVRLCAEGPAQAAIQQAPGVDGKPDSSS